MDDETTNDNEQETDFASEVAAENERKESQPVGFAEDLENQDAEGESGEGDNNSAPEEAEKQADEDLERKREAYRERQRKRKEKEGAEAKLYEAQRAAQMNPSPSAEDNDEIAQLKRQVAALQPAIQEQQFNQALFRAEQELNAYEKEYREVQPDYDDIVTRAINLTKARLVASGQSESAADAYLRREKVLLADRAAAQGDDPVEAVYNEAKAINDWFESQAEAMGFVRKDDGKKKTNLAALREASKPSAATGQSGKGARAKVSSFDENQDLNDIHNTTLGELWGS